jgi:hypothetical protein
MALRAIEFRNPLLMILVFPHLNGLICLSQRQVEMLHRLLPVTTK